MNLSTLSTLNPAAIAVFNELASRERFRKETNIKVFFKELKRDGNSLLNYDDVASVFENLQKLNLGSIIAGRNGKAERFIWGYNLKDVVRAAKGELPLNEMEVLMPLSKLKKSSFKKINSNEPVRHVTTTSKGQMEIITVNPKTKEINKYSVEEHIHRMIVGLLDAIKD